MQERHMISSHKNTAGAKHVHQSCQLATTHTKKHSTEQQKLGTHTDTLY